MSEQMDGWSALRQAGRSTLLAACGLGFGITLATAQEGQQVVPKTAKTAAEETSWVKLCTKDERTGNKEVCLIKHEGLEPKTGAILVAAAVRTTEGDDKHYLLVNVPTSYSLVMPAGVQIKVDEGEPIQLQYSVCLPTNCQVQMEVSKEMLDKMRKGKQMFIAAMNAQQKTMAFPVPLKGFARISDGAPVNNAAYQESRNQMLQAVRQRQSELAKQAAEARKAGGQPQAAPPAAAAPAAPPPPQ